MFSPALQASSFNREVQIRGCRQRELRGIPGLLCRLIGCQDAPLNWDILLLHFGWGDSCNMLNNTSRNICTHTHTGTVTCIHIITHHPHGTAAVDFDRPLPPRVLRPSFTQRSLPPFIRCTKTAAPSQNVFSYTCIKVKAILSFSFYTALQVALKEDGLSFQWMFGSICLLHSECNFYNFTDHVEITSFIILPI